MLVSAADTTPSTPAPAADGGATGAARGTGASDFLTLLGDKMAAKKSARTKPPIATPGAAAKRFADAANGEPAPPKSTSLPATVAIADLTRQGATGKATAKIAGETKAEGEAVKAQQNAALPSAILAALSDGAKGKVEPEAVAAAGEGAHAADEIGKAKPKAARSAERREKLDFAGKGEAAAKPSEPTADAAKAAKAETTPQAQPAAAKTTEAQAAPVTSMLPADADPQARPLSADVQLSDVRIPLATREAAQSGIAAPILAMRVITKDGVAKSIEIRLDPAELGEVNVKLETGADGKLKAVLSAENADAFELLKKDSGALESALREAGVDLGEDAITFNLADSSADQSQQREAAYGGAEARRTAAEQRLAATAEAAIATSWRDGVLDISV